MSYYIQIKTIAKVKIFKLTKSLRSHIFVTSGLKPLRGMTKISVKKENNLGFKEGPFIQFIEEHDI
jgi:hypothetical protein